MDRAEVDSKIRSLIEPFNKKGVDIADASTFANDLEFDSLTVMDDKLKIASIPAVFVFGVDGKLARMFDESSGESFTYEKDVTPFVKELVAQSFSAETGSTNE